MQTLRLFFDVARLHSFSQAATLHGITQSAASQRVGQLEKKLGVTLIDRSVRPLGLTEAGKLFLEGCDDLLMRYDQLERQMAGMRDKPHGVVRVAAIYSAGIDLLNHVRETFEQKYDQIAIELHYQQPNAVYRKVVEHDCDLGIVSYPQRWGKLEVISLRNEIMVAVCRSDHPLASQTSVTPQALNAYEMICLDSDLPAGKRIRQYLRDHGGDPRITDSFDNIDTIKGAVEVTQEVAILPRRTVQREVMAGTLACITLEPPLSRPLGIVYRKRAKQMGDSLSPPAQLFVDYLQEHAGEHVDLIADISPSSEKNALHALAAK